MIEVRHAKPEDSDALAAVGLAAWKKGIKPLVPTATAVRIERENPFVSFLQDLGPRVLVAVCDGKAAGIGASENADDCISDIWVDPAFEGRGAGSALIRALEGEIHERGFCEARIKVAAANMRALRLYEHLGYVQVARETDFDPILGVPLEKIELAKELGRLETTG